MLSALYGSMCMACNQPGILRCLATRGTCMASAVSACLAAPAVVFMEAMCSSSWHYITLLQHSQRHANNTLL